MNKIAKKPKFKPKRTVNKDNNEELRKDLRNWILITICYIPIIIVLYGTAKAYYPDPIPLFIILGLQFYGDISTGIIYLGIAVWSLISYLIFQTRF